MKGQEVGRLSLGRCLHPRPGTMDATLLGKTVVAEIIKDFEFTWLIQIQCLRQERTGYEENLGNPI